MFMTLARALRMRIKRDKMNSKLDWNDILAAIFEAK